MRTKTNHDALAGMLRVHLGAGGPATAPGVSRALGISQPVFSRLVGRLRDELIVVGRARSTRYALRRMIPEVGDRVPIYEIDALGQSRLLAMLHAIAPRGFYVDPAAPDVAAAFHDDLPYFLYDQRPSGFLGRFLPLRHPELELPNDVRLWSGDHCLKYLTRYGWNVSGNLIVGDAAFQRYLQNTRAPADGIDRDARHARYPQLAEDMLAAGAVGSSATGEQPKFLVTDMPGARALLVKFSPPTHSALGQRTADLLVCEHVGHGVLARHGQDAAKSSLVAAGERVFLEVERFDRLAGGGRRGMLSLSALDLEFVGHGRGWTHTSSELERQGLLDAGALQRIRWLALFGQLIANTDMHLGNLSLLTCGSRLVGLAPAYDMLPMWYAPQHGQMVERPFDPPMPTPADAALWTDVCAAAIAFWEEVAVHPQVSPGFQAIAAANRAVVTGVLDLGRKLPQGHQ